VGYRKIIQYGRTIETYEYQYNLVPKGVSRRPGVFKGFDRRYDLEKSSFLALVERYGHNVQKYERQYNLQLELSARESKENASNPIRNDRRQDNIKRLKRDFIRLVRANVEGVGKPYFVTLTFLSIVGIESAWRCFHSYTRRLRRSCGGSFSYISVVEFQKRGSAHFHILYWGLDETLKNERHTRQIQHLWGYGYVDTFPTDGSPKFAQYIAKYMQKAVFDKRLSGQKAYTVSRNALRPVQTSIFTSFAFLDELVDGPPCKVNTYDTMYLGRCQYKQYINKAIYEKFYS